MLHLSVWSAWIIRLFICLAIPARGRSIPKDGLPKLGDPDYHRSLETTQGAPYQRFHCATTNSKLEVTVDWFLNGTEILNTSPFERFSQGRKERTFWLELNKPKLSDSGSVIACHLRNIHGTTWKNVTLIVISEEELGTHIQPSIVRRKKPGSNSSAKGTPVILLENGINVTSETLRKVYPAGETVVLTCPVVGNPEPVITWLKDGHEPEEFLIVTPGTSRASSLTIDSGNVHDSGNYTCIAKNDFGMAQIYHMVEFDPVIEGRPIIESDYPKNTTVYVGQPAVMQCKILSNAHPTVTWYRYVTTNDSVGKHEDSLPVVLTAETKALHFSGLVYGWTECCRLFATGTSGSSWKVHNGVQKLTEKNDPVWINEIGDFCEPKRRRSMVLGDPTKYNVSDPLGLIILNTTFDDSGKYGCLISNGDDRTGAAGEAFVSVEAVPPKVYSTGDWEVKLIIAAAATLFFGLAIVVVCWYKRKASRMAEKTMLHIPISTYRKRVKVIQRQESESENSILDRIFVEEVWQPAGSSLNSGSFVTTQATTISHCNSTIEYELPLDEEWEYSREQLVDLNLEKPLGEGAFGKVVKATAGGIQRDRNGRRDEKSGEIIVAVKTSKNNATEQEFIALIGELEIMKTIGSHPNIINLLGCCTLGGPLYVIVEYAPYGNLRDFLRNIRTNEGYELPIGLPCLSQYDLGRFAYEIAQGMEYLASKRVIHRDLAARNILVAEDNVTKIADFGLAKDVYGQEYYRKITSGREPIKWMALEALVDRVYTSKSDIWSFGILLWEIMSFGNSPYPTINDLETGLIPFLKSGRRLNKPECATIEMYELMLRCWQTNPSDRPSFSELTERLNTLLTNSDYLIIPSDELPVIEINQQYMLTPAREPNQERDATPKSQLLKPLQ